MTGHHLQDDFDFVVDLTGSVSHVDGGGGSIDLFDGGGIATMPPLHTHKPDLRQFLITPISTLIITNFNFTPNFTSLISKVVISIHNFTLTSFLLYYSSSLLLLLLLLQTLIFTLSLLIILIIILYYFTITLYYYIIDNDGGGVLSPISSTGVLIKAPGTYTIILIIIILIINISVGHNSSPLEEMMDRHK